MTSKSILLLSAMMLLAACQKPADPQDPGRHPVKNPYAEASTDRQYLVSVGDEALYEVNTNTIDLVCSSSEEALECRMVNDSTASIVLKSLNHASDKNVEISFSSELNPEINFTEKLKIRSACCIDVEFQEDGKVRNVSPLSMTLKEVEGSTEFTYFSVEAGRNVARFSPEAGSAIEAGYYVVDYGANKIVKPRIEDGFSIEVQVMVPERPSSPAYIFSSLNNAGFGLFLDGDFCFKCYTSGKNGSPTGTLVKSGVRPEPGRYYHITAVWDKDRSEARLYVDGELKGNAATAGSALCWPSSSNLTWMCIGGNPAGTASAEGAWKGDIVLSRIYDAVLASDDVKALWDKANVRFPDTNEISDILFLSNALVPPEGTYPLAGNGIKAGDVLRFSKTDGTTFDCATAVHDGRLLATLPKEMTSGFYRIFIVRSGKAIPAGSVNMNVEEGARGIKAPDVVAHRGFHSGNARPENSIAALKAAQDLGCYGSETDCWITTDGEVFINHDGTIGGVKIQNSTSAQVAAVTLANGEPVPTFRQYLAQAAKNTATRLVIEIKEHSDKARDFACIDSVMGTVREMRMEDFVEYIAFSFDDCKYILGKDPQARVGYLYGNYSPAKVYEDGIGCIDYPYETLFARMQIVLDAQKLGMFINIWTVDTEALMLKSIGYGIDAVTTDQPDKLKALSLRLFGE